MGDRDADDKPIDKPKSNLVRNLIIAFIVFCVLVAIIVGSLYGTGYIGGDTTIIPPPVIPPIENDSPKPQVQYPVVSLPPVVVSQPLSPIVVPVAPVAQPIVCPYASGDIVQCPTTSAIYKIENGLRRLFTPAGWQASGNPSFKDRTTAVCTDIQQCPDGGNITAFGETSVERPCPYPDGLVVQCSSGPIYRIERGLRRMFTPTGWQNSGNPPIFESSDGVCSWIQQCPAGADIN